MANDKLSLKTFTVESFVTTLEPKEQLTIHGEGDVKVTASEANRPTCQLSCVVACTKNVNPNCTRMACPNNQDAITTADA